MGIFQNPNFGLKLTFSSVWQPKIRDKVKIVHLKRLIHCLLAVSNKQLPFIMFNKSTAAISKRYGYISKP